jgi:citrate lyase subunit beta / citryl-CoA lyase
VNTMSDVLRPRRSVLYMPGANQRAMQKARELPADGLILDLEDAVAPEAKEMAREQVVSAVREGGFGKREVMVRINPLDSPWGKADLKAASGLALDGIVVPKIENAQMVADVVQLMTEDGACLPVWAMLETPLAIMRVADIALNAPNLGVLLMGTSDLSKELRLPPEAPSAGLMWSLQQSVIAARSAGVDIIDGVHLDLADTAGFAAACQRARALGFDGKSLIHPKQIATANQTFAPSDNDITQAHAVMAAHAQALEHGSGVAVLNGKLVENLHVEQAKRTLAVSAAIGALAPKSTLPT